jgi:hypothetical protein
MRKIDKWLSKIAIAQPLKLCHFYNTDKKSPTVSA